MCKILGVARSGFYAWVRRPLSDRSIEDERLVKLIREAYKASDGVYGSPRVFLDLREAGERVGRKRVARLMREHRIRAVRGYKKPRHLVGVPSVIAPNRLQRQFTVDRADSAWVTDITYIRTLEGWLYLAVVMDLHSRKIVGWSMQPTLARGIGDRTYKLGSGITSEYGRYVKSLGDPVTGRREATGSRWRPGCST